MSHRPAAGLPGFARVAAVAIALLLAASHAVAADGLYRAATIVTGQGGESRAAGIARCFTDVIVKVSGDPRLASDPRTGDLAGQAQSLVEWFGYRDRMAGIPVHDEQGTRDRPFDLTVDFRPAGIDSALARLGSRPWLPPRPRLLLLVSVRNADTRFILTGDDSRGRDMRDALAVAGDRFGLDARLPEAATLDAAGLAGGVPAQPDVAALAQLLVATRADVALIGKLDWRPAARGWTATWRLAAAPGPHAWTIDGVSFDAAFRSGIGGAAQVLSGNGAPQ